MTRDGRIPNDGFLTDYERDVILTDALEALGDIARHFGMDVSLGYELQEDKIRARKRAREYPDRMCMRHQCDNAATWWDFDVFHDGRAYCDEHRPEPRDVG